MHSFTGKNSLYKFLKLLVRFRILQLWRELHATGLFVSVILILLIVPLLFLFVRLLANPETEVIAFLLSFCPILPFLNRGDHNFLFKFVRVPQLVRSIEYLLLCLPGLLIFLVHGYITYSLCLLLIVLSAGFLKPPKLFISGSGYNLSRLPSLSYEWKAGIRGNLKWMAGLFLLSLILCYFPYVSLVLVWVLHILQISFYQRNEPGAYLRAAGLPAKRLLVMKIMQGILLQSALTGPLFILYAVFHGNHFYSCLYLFLAMQISLCCSIIVKYAYYIPMTDSGPAKFFQTLSALSFIIPFLIPLPLISGLYWFNPAVQNIKRNVT